MLYIGLNQEQTVEFKSFYGQGSVGDVYSSSSLPPSTNSNNPNSLRYKIMYRMNCSSCTADPSKCWTVALYDCAGNSFNGDSPGTPDLVTYFGGRFQGGSVFLNWSLTSTNFVQSVDVMRRKSDGMPEKINSEIIPLLDQFGKQPMEYSFVDHLKDLPSTWETLWYSLDVVQLDGGHSKTKDIVVQNSGLKRLAISASSNPFRNVVNLEIINSASDAKLWIYDIEGQVVRELTPITQGEHRVAFWDGKDGRGLTAPSGVYVAVARSVGQVSLKKLSLLR